MPRFFLVQHFSQVWRFLVVFSLLFCAIPTSAQNPPIAQRLSFEVFQELKFETTVLVNHADPGGTTPRFRILGTGPAGLVLNSVSGRITWTPSLDDATAGSRTIVVELNPSFITGGPVAAELTFRVFPPGSNVHFDGIQDDITVRPVLDRAGNRLGGSNWVAELVRRDVPTVRIGRLRPFYPANSDNVGFWRPVREIIPGVVPGEAVQLQVRVWDITQFVSFDAAVAANGIHGFSTVFNYREKLPLPNQPPQISDLWMRELTGFRLQGGVIVADNTPPVFNPIPDRSVPEGSTVEVALSAVDPNVPPQTLAYSIVSGPPGAGMVGNIFRWTPGEIHGPGIHPVIVGVSDGSASATARFSISVSEVNSPPFAPSVPNGLAKVGELFQRSLTATDSDLPIQSVTFQAVSVPPGVSVTSSGLVTWTPIAGQGGQTYSLVAQATDGGVPPLAVEIPFQITVEASNGHPFFTSLTNATIVSRAVYRQALLASDPDILTQILSYSLVSGPVGSGVTNGVFGWLPSVDQAPSTNPVVVAVSDGLVTVEGNFTVIVTNANTIPEWVVPESATIPELAFYSQTLVAVDPDVPRQALVYSLVEGPPGSEVSGGVFRWTPGEAQGPGVHPVVVSVTDGMATVSARFDLNVTEVNALPQFGFLPPAAIPEGIPFALALNGADGDVPGQVLNYALLSGPPGAQVNAGVLTWTPSENQGPSENEIVVSVSDGPASVTTTIRLSVTEANLPPAFTGLSSGTIPERQPYRQTLNAVDPDLPKQTLRYSLVSGPAGASVNDGIVIWTPSSSQAPSTNEIVVSVSDGVATVDAVFVLVVLDVNEPPSFPGLGNATIPEGSFYRQPLLGVDPDFPFQTLSYALVSGPPGSVVANGVFQWTPSESQGPSTNNIVVSVSDGQAVVEGTFRLIVSEINQPPAWIGLTEATVPEGTAYQQTLNAIDPDLPTQELIYSLVSGPPGSAVVNGVFQWTPPGGQGASTNIVVVSVSDGRTSVNSAFRVVVTAVNRPPTFEGMADVTVLEGIPFVRELKASDPDRPVQSLKYAMISGPAGSGVTNGLFRWTPLEEQGPSTNDVVVSVSDGRATVNGSFRVIVLESNRPPFLEALTNATIPEVSNYRQKLGGVDPDVPRQSLTYALVSGPPGATVVNGVFQWTPREPLGPSTQRVVVSVSDGIATVTGSFQIVVTEVNLLPVFQGLTGARIPELAAYRQVLQGADADLPSQKLTFGLVAGPPGSAVVDGAFQWTPQESQGPSEHEVMVSVSDGFSTNNGSFRLVVDEVNQPPAISGLQDAMVAAGELHRQALNGVDSDLPVQPLTYALVSGPAGSQVTDGVFLWRPDASQRASTNVVVVSVSDGRTVVNGSFKVVVPHRNSPPSFRGLTNAVVIEETLYQQSLPGRDDDQPAQTLVYSLVDGPPGAQVVDGIFRWLPDEAQGPSTNVITVAVSDGEWQVPGTFRVVVLESNRPPSWNDLLNGSVIRGETHRRRLLAMDADWPAQSLAFRLISGPAGATLINGELSWRPTTLEPGRFEISVSDGVISVPGTFSVTVVDRNDPPRWLPLTNAVINERSAYLQTLAAVDSDLPAQVLRYSLVSGPSGSGVTNGVFFWSPDEAQGPSTHTILVSVSDGIASAEAAFSVRVLEVNSIPGFTRLTNQVIVEMTEYRRTLLGVDPDLPPQPLRYNLVRGPAGARVSDGVFIWSPPEEAGPGTNEVIVSVSDGVSTVNSSFTLRIEEANRSPVLVRPADLSVAANAPVSLVLNASDPDLPVQPLRFSLVSGPSGAALVDRTFRWTPAENQGPATHPVTLRVTDGVASTEVVFLVTVTGGSGFAQARFIEKNQLPDGRFLLRMSGAGRWRLESSPDLRVWGAVRTFEFSGAQPVEEIRPATNGSQSFFRLVNVP